MDPKPPETNAATRRQTLAGAILVALLLLGGWWLMSTLQRQSGVEDCIASGRRDCAPVAPDK